MQDPIEAAAVLVPELPAPRRHKPTDQHLDVRFRILAEDEALSRVGGLADGGAQDPEDGARYHAGGLGGVGLYGELRRLGGRRLRRGDIIKMEIGPRRSRARIRCLGLVAWVRVDHDAALFRAGVGFVGVDRRDLRQD